MNGTNGNEPGYPENALVPYPVIVAATKGDPDAMKYRPHKFLPGKNARFMGGWIRKNYCYFLRRMILSLS